MGSNLEKIMEGVAALLISSNVGAPHAFGRKKLNERSAPPRVVWTEAESDFLGTDRAGGNPRKLWVQQTLVEIHCWGRNGEELQALWRNELVALQRIASTSCLPRRLMPVAESEQWLTQGEVAILTVTLQVPVLDEIVPTIKIDGWEYEHTSTPGDGWLEAWEE